MLKILKIFTRILDVILANGEKRLKYSFENILYIAFSVACAYGVYRLIGFVSATFSTPDTLTFKSIGLAVLAFIGIISCGFAGVYTLIAGIASQAVLLVFALLGSVISRSRGKNFIAFLVALISLAGCALVVLYIFGLLPDHTAVINYISSLLGLSVNSL